MKTNYNIPFEIGAKSYWDKEGQLQSEYDKLYNEFVPTSQVKPKMATRGRSGSTRNVLKPRRQKRKCVYWNCPKVN